MATEYDTRTDSESYDPSAELTTFPSGLRLADLIDMVRERPVESSPFAPNQMATPPSGDTTLS